MKNYDYKSKMNRNRKRYAKRIAGAAIATTFVLSTPIAPNVLSESGLKNVVSSSVVHAATDNLFEFNDTLTYSNSYYSEDYEETRHIVYGSPDNQMTFEDIDAFTIIMQLPEELSYLLEDPSIIDHLQGNGSDPNTYGKFVLTG